MISPDEAQEGIIAKLKGNATLVAWLTALSVASEIRESYWQADEFKYPNVRVDIGVCTPFLNDTCDLVKSNIEFSVATFSREASSKQCGHLIGLVVDSLFGASINHTAYKVQRILLLRVVGPQRAGEDVWVSRADFRMLAQE